MKIVIVGAGKVGEALCRDLASEGNDIILIEIDPVRLNKVIEIADITGLVGNGASYDVLMEAGADTSDVFIAVTESDELNIISSIMAKKIGAQEVISRVRNPEYSQNMEFVKKDLGISLMINPEAESARDIINVLRYPCAYNVDSFMGNKVSLVEFEVEEDSQLNGMTLKDYNMTVQKTLICIVKRGDEVHIPDGNFVLKAKDRIHVTGTVQAINEFILNCKYSNGVIRSALIIGGNRIAYYLIEKLLEKKVRVKLIEIDRERAEYFSHAFPHAVVINADGTDQDLLTEEGIENYDAVLSLTGIDEENIIVSMFADSVGVGKNITKINRNILNPIIEKLDLDTIITPKKIIADIIIKFVRSKINSKGSKVENLHRLVGNQVEAIHFSIKDDSKAIGIPLKDLKTLPELLLACIKRGNEIIYPGGHDYIVKGDQVLVVTKNRYLDEFDDILVD